MADENYRSNRTGGAFARAAQPAYPGYATPAARSDQSPAQSPAPGDPLAELARLIGQNDPFADFGRPPAPREPYPTAEAPQQQAYHPPAPAYAPDPGYPSNPAYTESPAFGSPNEQHYTDRYDRASFDHANAGHGQAYPPAPADAGYESAGYAASDAAAGTYQPDPFYRAEHAMPAASDDMYEEDAPPPRRRGGLGIVAGIVALALVGTGAAYGYRTLVSGSSGKSAPPPVIKADGIPNKVIPPSSGDSQTGKMTDRVGEPGQGERMVSREEKPVDIKDASRPGQPPRVIFPGPVANQGAQPSGTSALASAPSPNAWAEPKKVRTEVIRPDRPDRPVSADTNAQPPSNTRSAAPARTAAAATPPPDSNGPLSLAPQNGQQPAARTRTAAAPGAPSATPAAAPTGTGAYVQVSSRGSEADAQASFRALQTKFPSQLGGQSPVIRRADLGDKGVFFRALVGPYSTEQATTMCVNLKAAGGACVVQRN